jgi:acetyl-CoA decarbonylase/synthase complex subunit gamma/4Fe-4S ferredoxin
MAAELKVLDIFKLLPGTNCRNCGEPTCLAFAVKLAGRDTEIAKCAPLFSEKYHEKRQMLPELLRAAGFDVPRVFLNP